MTVKMVSPRDYRLATLHGHVIFFPAGEPIAVPDSVVAEALAVNIMPASQVDADGGGSAGGAVRNGAIALSATLRDAVILRSIDELAKANDTENFNAGGQPKVAVLNSITGIRLSGAELNRYWDRYREIVGTNAPMPSHPRAESVLELQRLTTRKQLVEFASEIGIDKAEVTKRSLRDAKEFLMGATIAYMEGAEADEPVARDTRTLEEQ